MDKFPNKCLDDEVGFRYTINTETTHRKTKMKAKTIAAKLDKLQAMINSSNPYHESNPKYFDFVAPKEIQDLSIQYDHYLDLYSKALKRERAVCQ